MKEVVIVENVLQFDTGAVQNLFADGPAAVPKKPPPPRQLQHRRRLKRWGERLTRPAAPETKCKSSTEKADLSQVGYGPG